MWNVRQRLNVGLLLVCLTTLIWQAIRTGDRVDWVYAAVLSLLMALALRFRTNIFPTMLKLAVSFGVALVGMAFLIWRAISTGERVWVCAAVLAILLVTVLVFTTTPRTSRLPR